MTNAITVTLPDGSKKQYPSGTTVLDITKSIGEGLARAALFAIVNGKQVHLDEPLKEDATLRIITFKDKEGRDSLRHSCAHLLAASVISLWPGAKNAIGPAIDNGFYQDFDLGDTKISEEDFPKIEQKMREMLETWDHFDIQEVEIKKAKKDFAWNPYKLELIEEFAGQGKTITETRQGEFLDLCRGGHLDHPKKHIKGFKLLSVAGAYWRGSEKNKMLTRIYGTAFPSKKELDEYLHQIEEAKKRDHRKLGKALDLFSINEIGAGMPFIHPKGMVIWGELEKYWREVHHRRKYLEVKTPQLLHRSLWETSGHWTNYKEHMYTLKIDDFDYALKPMNCPGGLFIYKMKNHSYREFPLRLGEIGNVHRHELSGVLSGLFRVRTFHQDDAHIFMMPEQVKDEILEVLSIIDEMYSTFGFNYHLEFSTRPEKSIGSDEAWKQSEATLQAALDACGKGYKVNAGDGAFYGPKIDVHIKDCIGRTWQCATIQVDMNQPERFDVTYEGSDGKRHRPVMIHRVVYGSIERFFGILIEHYAGKFPLWLSPVQAIVLTVADRHNEYAGRVAKELEGQGFRVELDTRSESIPRKVREAQLQQANYILVVGDKEVENKTANVRTRDNVIQGEMNVEKLALQMRQEVKERR
ncbi:threonine--tRNA ligase [Candidatus Woesearchaeota archaeon]|nr:threonine--tRNA ligase [Candidatus Woesearchaeota archaeon]